MKAFQLHVMAPLYVTDWNRFRRQLDLAKSAGVSGVSYDIWWSEWPRDPDHYRRLADEILAKDMRLMPIVASHACGGNVGDTFSSTIPVWDELAEHAMESEFGQRCYEVVSVFAWDRFAPRLAAFYGSLRSELQRIESQCTEINLSLGPAGELRYPSYNRHDSEPAGYPYRGGMQCYDTNAQQLWRQYLRRKYNNDLDQLRRAWARTDLTAWDEIRPPRDAHLQSAYAWYLGGGFETPMGQDLVSWYHEQLLHHGISQLDLFQSLCPSTRPVGIKIAGIHWRRNDPKHPRSAEVHAGLVVPGEIRPYQRLFRRLKDWSTSQNRELIVHFTCAEMISSDAQPDHHSDPEALVEEIKLEAKDADLVLMLENALEFHLQRSEAWQQLRQSCQGQVAGLNLLRSESFEDPKVLKHCIEFHTWLKSR